jgi:hypothetical protein
MTPAQRPAIVTMPITLALFFGGGVGGVALASLLAPDSILANFVGLLALPFAFITGMQFWLGFALFSALIHGVRRLLGRAEAPRESVANARAVPPGAYAFLFTSAAASIGSGFIIGLVSTRTGVFSTLLIYLLVGLVYGVACWLLAGFGFLPFPEE